MDVFTLKTNSVFVLVRTNEGITGLGECSPMNRRVIASMLRDSLVPIVLGKNPLDIGRIWDEMFHTTYKLGVMGAKQAVGIVNEHQRYCWLAGEGRR